MVALVPDAHPIDGVGGDLNSSCYPVVPAAFLAARFFALPVALSAPRLLHVAKAAPTI
jgi:hypothetical protein